MKIFLWRFCRNNIPVRNHLRYKGVPVMILCPMCCVDVEHILHLFFDCIFARSCWQVAGIDYDMARVESGPEWLLNKLETSTQGECVKIVTIMLGIWFWRNKKVWEDKTITADLAMEMSFRYVVEWRKARKVSKRQTTRTETETAKISKKWCPPPQDYLKLNVDASFFPQADAFSVGMVIRSHNGDFVGAKVTTLPRPSTVLEAESIGIREALTSVLQRGERKLIVESDSLLSIQAVHHKKNYLLEVGHVIEDCKMFLHSMPDCRVTHIRKQANKVAHSTARIPCSIICSIVFTSPPSYLLETLMNDFSNE
ncbi:uncharacterized protein LOC141718682 [Apium graveolens]|uniref:uncharacterized protein LOC141718682 n=1 Tax=Apium graveolens TaxID=4045 RepID=UPI003D7B6CA4